ncbi:MAG TPA: ClbS/DfsB family four-helix bundle protein [Pelolinea sp.]|nr:ClbS/DfsB family four-helix bundle protein [Pelolinea sp.]
MENAQLKTVMLELFTSMRGELDTVLKSLTDGEKKARGSMEKWSVKDMLAHLAFWGSHFNHQVEKALAGEAVPVAGDYYEILNDGVLMRNLDTPFEKAREEEEAAYKKTVELLEGISSDDLNNTEKFAFLNNRTLIDRALGTECWHVLAHVSDFYVKKGKLDKAEELQVAYTEKLKNFPNWKANSIYNLACFYSLNGMKEKAFQHLKAAFKERPELKEWSKQDPDMKPICEEMEYKALVK